MKRYEVISKYASFPPGQILGLSRRQADARAPFIKPLGNGRFEVLERTGFKGGEILGIEGEIAKAGRKHFLPLDESPPAAPEPVPVKTETPEELPEELPEPELGSENDGDKLDKLAEILPKLVFDDESVLEDGRPKVSALKRLAGIDVTAEERDMVWELIKE